MTQLTTAASGTSSATGPASTREPGLEGVVAFRTRLSKVDGDKGELVLAGHSVEDLARRAGFEEVFALLFEGALPSDGGAALRSALGRARVAVFEALDPNDSMLRAADGMSALRALVARVAEPQGGAAEHAIAMVAAVGVFASAWQRVRVGHAPLAPDASLTHAADMLRMSSGAATQAQTRALDRYLVTVVDHGANASTFAARVVASTGGSSVSAVVAAIGALAGPLHGGAPGPVLDMLESIGAPQRAAVWIDAELAAGRRIMGMGHRVYRVRDPRAAVLEEGIAQLAEAGVASEKLALARATENAATEALSARHPDRALRANVEFYTAVILDAVGIHRSAFTLIFAASRTLGWCAHIDEQRTRGRLIRPASEYVGALPVA